MSRLLAILYRSEALMPQCGVVERKMLEASRSDNVPKHITGFLHRENDVYYQWLEGPEAEVNTLFEKIAMDDRHRSVKVLSRHRIPARSFPAWTMGYANTNQDSLFDWAAKHDIPLHSPRPEDILAFLQHNAERVAR